MFPCYTAISLDKLLQRRGGGTGRRTGFRCQRSQGHKGSTPFPGTNFIMAEKLRVYLAGQSNEYENNWKKLFKALDGFQFHDWEFDSGQTSPDTFFPDDLNGVKNADIMVANPGIAPSEGTWIEIGCFYANNVKKPGDFCDRLIIVWNKERNPRWSIEFVKKTGTVVGSVEESLKKLKTLVEK